MRNCWSSGYIAQRTCGTKPVPGFRIARDDRLKLAFQLRSFFAGDFGGGGAISPGFNGVAGLGIDGANGGGSGAGSLSLQAANIILNPKRVTTDSDPMFFIAIHLLCL